MANLDCSVEVALVVAGIAATGAKVAFIAHSQGARDWASELDARFADSLLDAESAEGAAWRYGFGFSAGQAGVFFGDADAACPWPGSSAEGRGFSAGVAMSREATGEGGGGDPAADADCAGSA